MGGTCGTHRHKRKHIQLYSYNIKAKDHLEELRWDGRVDLKFISNQQGLKAYHVHGQTASSFEHDHKPSVYFNQREISCTIYGLRTFKERTRTMKHVTGSC
jgi:hypothetical protein